MPGSVLSKTRIRYHIWIAFAPFLDLALPFDVRHEVCLKFSGETLEEIWFDSASREKAESQVEVPQLFLSFQAVFYHSSFCFFFDDVPVVI